ncbi:unnamed protein product [Ectocarpus sp. CCAP 1310/34]|nr:unnamed protein product [Ectocarpus sp. CCAP 1310/34]CAB1103688.1 unnamed protein product [Ectocarpus sp. CCAP 1310/34]
MLRVLSSQTAGMPLLVDLAGTFP